MMRILPYLLAVILLLPAHATPAGDTEKLGKALEYFSSGKYHEALILFEELDKDYRLNPRFHAYMGVCYYQEWEYEKAVKYLEAAIPQLTGFSPREQSVYVYANAESLFNLQQYEKAIPYYEQALNLCHDNEKGDAYYRLGFCHMFANDWIKAYEHFTASLAYYQRFRNNETMEARMAQIKKMIKGCEERLGKDQITYYSEQKEVSTDSINLDFVYRDTLFIDSIATD